MVVPTEADAPLDKRSPRSIPTHTSTTSKHNQKGSMLERVRYIIYSTNMKCPCNVTRIGVMATYTRTGNSLKVSVFGLIAP
jgi:hypothetical protein